MKYIAVIIMNCLLILGCQAKEKNENIKTVRNQELKESKVTPKIGGYYNINGSISKLACIYSPNFLSNKANFLYFDDSNSLKYFQSGILSDTKILAKCNTDSTQEYNYASYLPKNIINSGFVFNENDFKPLIVDHKFMGVDFNHDGKKDTLTHCTSSEGEHLNAWLNNEKKIRLAYAYHYLNADLVPNCKDSEIYEIDLKVN